MILVVNAGSSSVKVALFDGDREVIRGAVTEIGGAGTLSLGDLRAGVGAADHAEAMTLLLDALTGAGHPVAALTAAAHRVVHGGSLTEATRATPEALAAVEAAIPLAPLHNPANLAGVRALQGLAPALPQTLSLDTAFHATLPEAESTYALPPEWRARGLRRTGFHGISYASLSARLRTEGRLPEKLLAFHLGNGASACAIRDGRSVATTMGHSPLDGLVMGTRAGSLDGMAVLAIAREVGVDGAERVLNRESGLLGLAGESDMARLLARNDPEAQRAVAVFVHAAIRHGGALVAAMGGVDALAFTGGIGENAAEVRDAIAAGLSFLGPLPVHVVAAREEAWIAAEARAILSRTAEN